MSAILKFVIIKNTTEGTYRNAIQNKVIAIIFILYPF
jgi:hypothetical protein